MTTVPAEQVISLYSIVESNDVSVIATGAIALIIPKSGKGCES